MVRSEFGRDLQHMTPANVREFLDRVNSQTAPGDRGAAFRLDESHTSYESILRDFFLQVLEVPPEEAIIPLWTLAVELAFADLKEVMADQMRSLFPDEQGS